MEPLIPSLQTQSLAREGLFSIWTASSELGAPGRGSMGGGLALSVSELQGLSPALDF